MTKQEFNELEYGLDDLIEGLEYELEEANELKSKAIAENHEGVLKTANTQILIAEAKLWKARHNRNLTISWEDLAHD